MVDENMVRKDVSFAEMAELARSFVADPQTGCKDVDKAVSLLFQSAGYQKRSYIRAFVELLDCLGDLVLYAHEIPRNLGLELRRKLEQDPEIFPAIAEELKRLDAGAPRSAEDELAVLRRWGGAGEGTFPAGKIPGSPSPPAPRKARVTFEVTRPVGLVKCTAANGRFEIRLPLDFTTVDRRKLEAAVRRLLDDLA
jgi:ParB family chromosome partitioning protein